jgi:anti-sigma regulatory factor (Ser/Thr protein kinase)
MTVGQEAAAAAVTSATYPGTAQSVPAARRFVRALAAGCPRAYDLELVAAEFISNAILHTPSGLDGGTFTVTVRHRPGWARVEVTDLGTLPWRPVQTDGDRLAEHGRGLAIVAALADEIGHAVEFGHQVIWATLSW